MSLAGDHELYDTYLTSVDWRPRALSPTADQHGAVPFPRNLLSSPQPLSSWQSDESFGLLDRASIGMLALVRRYEVLQDEFERLDAWSTARVQAAEDIAEQWKAAAVHAERKLDEAERSAAALARRADSAEQAMRQDRAALNALQDRILIAFGIGSEAEVVLNEGFDEFV